MLDVQVLSGDALDLQVQFVVLDHFFKLPGLEGRQLQRWYFSEYLSFFCSFSLFFLHDHPVK